jgi:YaiO family outer membrane protein
MIGRTFWFFVSLVATFVLPLAARGGELDLTGSLSSFSSPGNLYGPWRSVTLSDREQIGKDKPGLSLVDRADADAGGPTHGLGAVLDDYHDWSSKFFSYVAVGVSSGNLLPTRSVYLEGDAKFGPLLALVVGAGAGVTVNPDGTIQRYFNVGPTWYHGNMNVTLRWLPSFTNGRMGASSVLLTLANGAEGKTVTTLTLLGGNQPPNGIVVAEVAAGLGQRVLLGGISVKHWLSPKSGYTVGLELERLTNSTTGNEIYLRRGLDVGIFRVIGR